jgi:hypothetical protein
MLDTYLAQTRRLLQNPGAPTALYSTADLTAYINQARGQTAADGECIRRQGTLSLTAGNRVAQFSALVLNDPAVSGAYKINQVSYGVGSGQRSIDVRPWAWFQSFLLSNPIPPEGAPREWAQYAQGVTGDIYVDPLPDTDYTLYCDCVCKPIDLVTNATAESIPQMWQDAVPFLAAYWALLAAQSAVRQADADRMMARYEEFRGRARRFANPAITPHAYSQQPDPTQLSKLGLQPRSN